MAAEWLKEFTLNSADVRETGNSLGKGSYGEVVEVEYLGKLCAAKRIHVELKQMGGKPEEEFKRECEIWSRLRHPNVVQLLGLLYRQPMKLPEIVTEKMDCTLHEFTVKRPREEVPLAVKINVLYQVAQGLAYLHGQRPPVVHRDLSPNNILIKVDGMTAKLSDFGVARVFRSPADSTGTSIPGTEHFMPPETFPQANIEGSLGNEDRIDVFSFGCIIICVVTHQWPFPTSPVRQGEDGQLVVCTEVERRQHLLDQFDPAERECFLDLVHKCLEFEPLKRPRSKALVESMKELTDTLKIQPPRQEAESPLDAVKAYIGSACGISLKAANGKYLSRVYRNKRHAIEAAKDVKDPCTRFEASVMNGKLVLKGDNGKYLSRIYRGNQYLEAEKDVPDVCCQFRVVPVGKGLIALQGDNGLYVSRILRGKVSSIEVTKGAVDDECKFMHGVGT